MVDKKTVEYVAKLARIDVSEQEKDYLTGQLSKILEYVDKLKTLDTDGVEPLRSIVVNRVALREDMTVDSGRQDAILKNAPASEDHHFKIPKVIE